MGTSNAKRNRNRRSALNQKGSDNKSTLFTPPSKSRKDEDDSDSTPNSNRKSHDRSKTSEDISSFGVSPYTGDTGDLFQQEVQVRARRERAPMNPVNRMKTRVATMRLRKLVQYDKQPLGMAPGMPNDFAPIDPSIHGMPIDSVHSEMPRKQFKVTTKPRKLNTLWGRMLCKINPDDFSYTPSGGMVRYINWTFKTNFGTVFLSFIFIFLLLVFIFGLFFKWAGEAEPECIIVSGKTFDYYKRGTTLADGFSLSWTTFTTVGYGSVYIATGNENPSQHSCLLITLLSTAESFMGLLYAGICTAIMFGKIGRIQSHAQVTFSDAMCVEYGKEKAEESSNSSRTLNSVRMSLTESIQEEGEDDVSSDRSDDEDAIVVRPIMKPQASFRSKRKIMCPVIKFQLVNQLCNEAGGEILDANMNVMVRKEKESYPFEPIARFIRVQLEEPSHPYFNRVWHARHVLDHNSPLVSVAARSRIRMNGGYWPEDLNSPQGVRENLKFSSVIITMTGISNISAESVQISKRYYHHDVLIGYDFAPSLYIEDGSEMLKVDMNLVNDVIEQKSAIAEELTDHEDTRPSLRQHDFESSAS
mmetsp:Transcript_1239/g.1890  ORF Transcript_1239/g.1890 Transcript_1239/m.1890 type:complete len:586 (+) Transcript_1239:136-1893(+)